MNTTECVTFKAGQKFMLGPQQGDIRHVAPNGYYALVLQPYITDDAIVPGYFVEFDPATFQKYIEVGIVTMIP